MLVNTFVLTYLSEYNNQNLMIGLYYQLLAFTTAARIILILRHQIDN